MFKKIRHIYHYWKNIFHNLHYWLPLIIKDRDWDFAYLEEMLTHKLEGMRNFYQGGVNVWSAEAPQVVAELNEILEIFKRIEEDNYEEAIDPHFNDWIKNGKKHFKEIIDEDGTTHHIFDTGEIWTEEEEAKRDEVYKQAEINKQADYDKAYGLIAKNIRKWWD